MAVLIVLMVVLASAGTGFVHRLEVDSTLVRIALPLVAMAIIGPDLRVRVPGARARRGELAERAGRRRA